jgi:hypothetical protein
MPIGGILILLGLDYESNGLPEKPPFHPTELGMALLDTSNFRIVQSACFLVNPPTPIDQFYLDFANVTQYQIDLYGVQPALAASALASYIEIADAAIVWNGYFFDRPLAVQELKETGYELPDAFRWIDLKVDSGYRDKLKHEAANHGFLMHDAHTALQDVLTMFEILKRGKLSADQLFEKAQSPMVVCRADVQYDTRHLASQRDFKWKADTKQWLRALREHEIPALEKDWGFRIIPVGGTGY